MPPLHYLIDQLRESSFSGEILTGPAARSVYSTDNSIYQVVPQASSLSVAETPVAPLPAVIASGEALAN